VRVVEADGDLWFAAVDVCRILDIKNITDALKNLDDDEANTLDISEGIRLGRGNPNLNFVNEPGLYRLIFQSRKPEAKAFKRWVFHEILPTIRKQAYYSLEEKLEYLGRAYEISQADRDRYFDENRQLKLALEDPVQTAKRELREYITKHYVADDNPNHYEDADYCYHRYEAEVEQCLSIDAFLAEVCAIVPGIRVKKRRGRHWSFLGLKRW
jgi:prophage antirepressor-like protein